MLLASRPKTTATVPPLCLHAVGLGNTTGAIDLPSALRVCGLVAFVFARISAEPIVGHADGGATAHRGQSPLCSLLIHPHTSDTGYEYIGG